MKISKIRKSEALIPTASMADIAFLLIIFFMVTTVHQVDRTDVNLPSAATKPEEAEKGAAYVVLSQAADGGLIYKFSDGEAMSREVQGPNHIYLEASRIAFQDDTTQFVLKADGELKFSLIDELMDQLRKGGVQNLLLLTKPKGGDGN
jgi:biopolymer transport protein ExbD